MSEQVENLIQAQPADDQWDPGQVDRLVRELGALRDQMLQLEADAAETLQQIPAERRASARNLLHYVGLRRHDIRELQEQLVQHGLSSLGRCESYVMENVEAVLGILSKHTTHAATRLPNCQVPVGFRGGRERLRQSTERLFACSNRFEPLIMVTMPSEAALDYELVRDLLDAGMSVMRINCAHDNPRAWEAMLQNLRRAEAELGRSCRVAMDLAGPKIRTGPIEDGPRVIRWKPRRDEFGAVTAPAKIWFSSPDKEGCPDDADTFVPVDEAWWQDLDVGDALRLVDARGRKRQVRILKTSDHGCLAECDASAYVTPQTLVKRVTRGTAEGSKSQKKVEKLGRLDLIPPKAGYLVLHEGDRLLITGPDHLGRAAQYDEHGRQRSLARISCTLPEIFSSVRVGDRVLLDDGKITAVTEEAGMHRLIVRITRARDQGVRLRADKGINFPDTELKLPALTSTDIEHLEFIARHADIVSYSFVRRPEDIRQLHQQLTRLGKPELGVILKIENRQAFENLPLLLLEAMRCSPATGVMIARGDLAVECGWERLVEVQEEILWMAEAAHMPVVWATQVLEGMAKTGVPSRAEITDAGMGARAECVMLNKGPNVVDTVRTLNQILRLMQQHQVKKRATFRRLHVAESSFG